MASSAPKYLSPLQLIDRWDGAVVLGTLANWRGLTVMGAPTDPVFQKFGTKVRYPVAAFQEYERANTHGMSEEVRGRVTF